MYCKISNILLSKIVLARFSWCFFLPYEICFFLSEIDLFLGQVDFGINYLCMPVLVDFYLADF